MKKVVKDIAPVDKFYVDRDNFAIIGVTGMSGSGCSYFAEVATKIDFLKRCNRKMTITKSDDGNNNDDAFHQGLTNSIEQRLGKEIFNRKYDICKKFTTKHYKTYQIIKYTYVVWLYTLLFLKWNDSNNFNSNIVKKKIIDNLTEKFSPSIKCSYITEYNNQIQNLTPIENIIQELDITSLIEKINEIYSKISTKDNKFYNLRGKDTILIYELFISTEFESFVQSLRGKLTQYRYYEYCMYCHRVAIAIRSTGNPFSKPDENGYYKTTNVDYLYNLASLINVLIKGCRRETGSCRIIIDSLRNSMESIYFRERYTAFYSVAIHCNTWEKNIEGRVESVLEKDAPDELKEITTKCIVSLAKVEAEEDDFDHGYFSSPDIGRCIEEAEIHITNPGGETNNKKNNIFYSLEEQWMKYASLILCPGLITPSSEERCMIVAYSAKYNSGCLSRQVGAVITNQYHAIRSIGWNDVPYGQFPCDLRSISDFFKEEGTTNQMYSNFEQINGTKRYDNCTKGFYSKVNEDFSSDDLKKQKELGYAVPYCFKTLENKYSGEKNQVYTRSLHAEENAMLQMVKYGGEGLKNGIIYVTASPCELCSKKLYQIGIRKIVYIDPYPGIAKQLNISCGYKRPKLVPFQGAYGSSYFKLYQPFMSYKDELSIRLGSSKPQIKTKSEILTELLKQCKMDNKATYSIKEYEKIINFIQQIDINNNI